jgi:eukaryotic-like serine/threonine-protein kinase
MPSLPSHYQLRDRLGAGGMGEVHRAFDTRLGRDVAIKMLPGLVAGDSDRIARLRREARALAALNHPNIAIVYDLIETDDTCMLVLEFVEGRTLADRVPQGPMPWRDALAIGVRIADALEAAHDKGIIHRDLKPANVMIGAGDRVKLLDFGLATGLFAAPSSSIVTEAFDLSTPGIVLGTPAYMSPEQARGLPLDSRTDIWAFGCVLYELLCGRRLFGAAAPADAIADILRGDPPLTLPEATVPERVHVLLQRCLRQDLRRRLHHIGDARIEMEDLLAQRDAPSGVFVATTVDRAVQFQRLTDTRGLNDAPAISPDGKMVAFVAPANGYRQIWIRLMTGGAPLQLTRDSVDHLEPRWAPDSSSLIYFTRPEESGVHATVWEIPALGGNARPIASAMGAADVSHDGRHLAFVRIEDATPWMMIQNRESGDLEQRFRLPKGVAFGFARWSPDDSMIALLIVFNVYFDHRILIVRRDGTEPTAIVQGRILRGLSWLPDSAGLMYGSSAGSSMLYPPSFNLRRIARDGTADRALTYGDASLVKPDVHSTGRIVACKERGQSDIWKFPVSGSAEENTRQAVRITSQTGQVQTPSVSPNGREMVYISDNGGHGNLWILPLDGSGPARQLTFERNLQVSIGVPVWSPVGPWIAFIVARMGESSLWLIRSDGTGLRQLAARGLAASWSHDGEWLYYTPNLEGDFRIEKVAASGGSAERVRDDLSVSLGVTDSTLYLARRVRTDAWDWKVEAASPPEGPATLLCDVAGARVPLSAALMPFTLSPNGRWLSAPLTDASTTNIWMQPTDGGPLRQVTDFGDRPTLIVRRLSWSPDSEFIYAAVADIDSDIVLLDGLL